METITLKRDDLRPLKFEGELIAKAESVAKGTLARGYTLELYRTKGGKLVSSCIGWSVVDGERNEHDARANEDQKGVFEFFDTFGFYGAPHDALLELYENAGFDYSEKID